MIYCNSHLMRHNFILFYEILEVYSPYRDVHMQETLYASKTMRLRMGTDFCVAVASVCCLRKDQLTTSLCRDRDVLRRIFNVLLSS